MLNVVLYTTQPILALGLGEALAGHDCQVAAVCTTVADLIDKLSREEAGVVLLDTSSPLTTQMLAEIKRAADFPPIVLWVDTVSTDFISEAVGMGVRGVLRKNLSLELQVRCLQKVGAGELWVEKSLVANILSQRRVSFTPREKQLAALLAQGLKNKEIAWKLGLSEGTVKVYLSRLFEKAGASDRFEMVLYIIEHLFGGRAVPVPPEAFALPTAERAPDYSTPA